MVLRERNEKGMFIYKDAIDYVYYRKLTNKGYVMIESLLEKLGCEESSKPDLFYDKYAPNSLNCWEHRKAIKKYIEENPKRFEKYYDLKIIKADGYWRDLHPFVYEIWGRKKRRDKEHG